MILDSFRERRPFPGQDPWVVPYDGSFLLVQSSRNDRQIVIRRFGELDRMDRNEETVIWRPPARSDHSHQIWAPELHHIAGRWYVYFAASNGQNENHRMYVLEADDPLGPYHEIGKICDRRNDTWAIDLTVLEHHGELYALWSGWEGKNDGFPQNLYIARMENPWTIGGERRLISRPQYGWEMTVAPINEGPQIVRNPATARIFVVYSADASWTQAYKMGLLEWTGGEVTDPSSWRKRPYPFFAGGGHGCFVEAGGELHLVYHRKISADYGWADREIRSEPVSWDDDGYPVVVAHGSGSEDGREPAPASVFAAFPFSVPARLGDRLARVRRRFAPAADEAGLAPRALRIVSTEDGGASDDGEEPSVRAV